MGRIWGNILKIVAVICTLLLIAGAGALARQEKLAAVRQQEKVEARQEQLEPYLAELTQLQNELIRLKSEKTFDEIAVMAVGFKVTGADDLVYVRSMAEQYGFTPALILDCTQSIDQIGAYITEADESWELVFHVPEDAASAAGQIRDIREYLQTLGRTDTGVVYLPRSVEITELSQFLTACGMIGSTVYNDAPVSGQNSDGTVYFDYSNFVAEHFDPDVLYALENRLSKWHSNKASMLCVFDVTVLTTEVLYPEQIGTVFETLCTYVTEKEAEFYTVSQLTQALLGKNQQLLEYQQSVAQRIDQLQARIDEVKQLIDDIYRSE